LFLSEFAGPGRPVENGFIESFNGRLRDERLNVEWFTTLQRRKQSSPNGGITTITCDLIVRSMIGLRLSLPNGTENRHRASPKPEALS